MKRKLLLCMAILLTASSVARAAYTAELRQALLEAVNEAVADLAVSPNLPKGQSISVLPIGGDQNGFVEGQLKNAITRAGLTYVEGRNDPIFDEILKEVEWDERKEDMLDPDTIDRFGELKSTRLLLYGRVIEASQNNQQAYAEIELHLTSIATKQHLWGDLVARRIYLPGNVTGLISLDANLRDMLQKAFQEYRGALAGIPALQGTTTIVIAPLAGDVDGYVASLAEAMLSGGNLTVSRANAPTLSGVRRQLQEAQASGHAVLTGAVRDLSVQLVETRPLSKIYNVTAEVQLRIEDALTGNTLWSENILTRDTYTDTIGVWDFFMENRTYAWAAIAGVLVLCLLFLLLRATTRAR